jgi:hypothetical protein
MLKDRKMSGNIYTYKINFLEVKNQLTYTKVVYIINYTFVTSDPTNTYSYDQPGQVELPLITADQEFTPFEQLSEAQLLSWLEAHMPEQDLRERTELGDKGLARLMEIAMNQSQTVYELPWAPAPVAPVIIEQVIPTNIEEATKNHEELVASGLAAMKVSFPGFGTPEFTPP